MASTVEQLTKRKLINPPDFVRSNTMYECIVGSVAYGVSDAFSDFDVNGFCIPPKDVVFPHLRGEIEGFGRQKKRFNGWQQHHVHDPDALGGKGREYDFNIYSIVQYCFLCMENNPNMLTTLYVPRNCILSTTKIGEMIREKRDRFLHKGAWPKFKGYAYSQLHKMGGKNPEPGSKRFKIREEYGFDVKFAYHTVRLLYEAEMILNEGTIDIQRYREHLKEIRRGGVSEEEIHKWANEKEAALERAYENSKLPWGPREQEIKTLLLDCLEEHYGNLDAVIARPNELQVILEQMTELTAKYQKIKDRT